MAAAHKLLGHRLEVVVAVEHKREAVVGRQLLSMVPGRFQPRHQLRNTRAHCLTIIRHKQE
jgi:hypothetical protein